MPQIPEDGSGEYYIIPEEALQYLPDEWREQIHAMADDGRAVLRSVDNELSTLTRVSNSFSTLMTLKHIQGRLAEYKFDPTMEAVLELDMLTTAFVVTYARLQQGGEGSGFARSSLPEELRSTHDSLIDLRNKRFAHNAAHESLSNAMEIGFQDRRFEVELKYSMGFHIGGANEWHELVRVIDAMYFDKLERIFAKLSEKTNREWIMPTGPAGR